MSLAIFFSFYRINFRGSCDSCESQLPLFWTIYFPTAPYSCHPYFGDICDVRIFMDVDPAEQRRRILSRNGPEMLPRFVSEWIPMEELYFKTFQIKEKCSICLTV